MVTDGQLGVMLGVVLPHLDERQRRLTVGAVARLVGRGGVTAVAEATGTSRSTVTKAVGEIDAGVEVSDRVRAPGAGRPRLIDQDPALLANLDDLVEPESRGDPMCPLRWTTKSTTRLAEELGRLGHRVSADTVGRLLVYMGYSLQATSKQAEGAQHEEP